MSKLYGGFTFMKKKAISLFPYNHAPCRDNVRGGLLKCQKALRCKAFQTNCGGGGWIRTIEVTDNRFTVCPLWPLGNPSMINLCVFLLNDYTPLLKRRKIYNTLRYGTLSTHFATFFLCVLQRLAVLRESKTTTSPSKPCRFTQVSGYLNSYPAAAIPFGNFQRRPICCSGAA